MEACPGQNKYVKSLFRFASEGGRSSPLSSSIWALLPDPKTEIIVININLCDIKAYVLSIELNCPSLYGFPWSENELQFQNQCVEHEYFFKSGTEAKEMKIRLH